MAIPHFDVLVLGAGTAGICAALQAARAGSRTLLAEKNGLAGGTMAAAAIAFPGLFYAWRKPVIAGIGYELVTRTVAECGGSLPRFEEQIGMTEHPKYQIPFEPLIFAAICDEAFAAAGVLVRYHTMAAAAARDEEGWRVTLCSGNGLETVSSAVLIDCSADAVLTRLAGYEVRIPDECQPGTLSCRVSGWDDTAIDREAIRRAAAEAVAGGELLYSDLGWQHHEFSLRLLETRGDNCNHIYGPSAALPGGRGKMEEAARASLLRAFRFLKKQKGLENLRLELKAFECGIRESAVIRGMVTITGEDYVSGRRWEDAVCNSFYPIDLHNPVSGVAPERLTPGTVPSVPLRALIPAGSENFLVAGRCVSSDRKANSALRVQASCMAMGQAAGGAAHLAAGTGIAPSELPIGELRKLLAAHGAILP